MNLKNILSSLRWLKILNSPFKPFKVSFYIGKIQIGIPYFYPRKWVKFNQADCLRLATESTQKKGHIHYGKDPNTLIDEYKNYSKPVPLKVGFSYCSLGWKTKYDSFRYEWGPILSFVFFGYQIALMVGFRDREAVDHYWESWLYYEYSTDKTKSKLERIEQCRKEAPATWRISRDGKEEIIYYYERILKPKYLK
jgi:hypothetical protein